MATTVSRAAAVALLFACGTIAAQELVISGRVLDTSGLETDKPLFPIRVVVVNEKKVVLQSTTTKAPGGFFHFTFNPASQLSGNENVKVFAGGYSPYESTMAIKLKRELGAKTLYVGDVLLTDDFAIRASPAYRTAVAKNAVQAQAAAGQQEKAQAIYASLAALPDDSKELAFGSVRAEGAAAYAELQRVDREVTKTKELATILRQKDLGVVPLYDPAGKILFQGTVGSQKEVETILREAGQKGFDGGKVVNQIRIQRGV